MKNEGATCFGTIQKIHHLSARGFCRIAPDDGGADVFAHVRDFASPIGGIERGDPVSYIIITDDRSGKPRARNIMRLPKEQFTGTVTAYSVGRGFRFIAPDSSFLDDVYVYESNLKASGIDKLETGDRVSFELLPKHPAKPRRLAVDLQIIESLPGETREPLASTHPILGDELRALRRLQREQEPESPFISRRSAGLHLLRLASPE